MAVWLVRAGKHGQREATALEKGVAAIDWHELPDLKQFKTREELLEFMRKTYPERNPRTLTNWRGQLWAFVHKMNKGDLIMMPLKSRAVIAVGEVAGEYEYLNNMSEDARHSRRVKWLKDAVPRASFEADLLFSLGALQTVCQIKRADAEKRIRALLTGKKAEAKADVPEAGEAESAEETEAEVDLEQMADDQISQRVQRQFAGHALSKVVSDILVAEGYQTQVSPPGADGGVDILAGKGSMGFDKPLLCVQVKSGSERQDVKVLRELKGVMKDFGADHGLFVSWGGFKDTVYKEARKNYFEIRLWSADDLIDRLLAVYDKLPDDVRAELPLKRVWMLVNEE